MIPSNPVSICLAALRSEVPTRKSVPSLRYCVAKQCGLKVATEGVSNTDWKVVLESLDLFEQMSRLKITDELPDPYANLVSADVNVRRNKLSECCKVVAIAEQNFNVPLFVAAGVRSRRDGDWKSYDDFEPNVPTPDLLGALLKKGLGFQAIEEAALGEVLADRDKITRWVAFPTLEDLVNRRHVSDAMVEAFMGCLTSDQNPDLHVGACTILINIIEKGLCLETIERKIEELLSDKSDILRKRALNMLVTLLKHNRGFKAAEQLLTRDLSTLSEDELEKSLNIIAKFAENAAYHELACCSWRRYYLHSSWCVSAAAIDILNKLVSRGCEHEEAERVASELLCHENGGVRAAAHELFHALFRCNKGHNAAEKAAKTCLLRKEYWIQRRGLELLTTLVINNFSIDAAKEAVTRFKGSINSEIDKAAAALEQALHFTTRV